MAPRVKLGPIGVLGGTFDPIHFGHLRLAEEAREVLGLARVIFIPAGVPPHRIAPEIDKRHRLAMVRRAIDGNSAFSVDDSEIVSEGPSYTHTTLARLRGEVGESLPLILVMGSDAFQGFTGWHRWREIADLAHIAIARRPGSTPDLSPELQEFAAARHGEVSIMASSAAGRVLQFQLTPLSISASRIRADLAAGRAARYLAPDPVLDYIRRHHLYRVS